MTAWRRDPGVLWRRSGDRRLLLPPNEDEVVLLEGVGSLVWDALETPMSEEQLIEDLASHFDVEMMRVGTDVTAFLDQLCSLGAVRTT